MNPIYNLNMNNKIRSINKTNTKKQKISVQVEELTTQIIKNNKNRIKSMIIIIFQNFIYNKNYRTKNNLKMIMKILI